MDSGSLRKIEAFKYGFFQDIITLMNTMGIDTLHKSEVIQIRDKKLEEIRKQSVNGSSNVNSRPKVKLTPEKIKRLEKELGWKFKEPCSDCGSNKR